MIIIFCLSISLDCRHCPVQAGCRISFFFFAAPRGQLSKERRFVLISLEHGVIFELYTKLLSFSSTQDSEIAGFAFEQIQIFKAFAKPLPISTLILSPFGCVKFTCKTEADVQWIHFITGHNTFLYGSVNGPKLLGKRKQKLYISKGV